MHFDEIRRGYSVGINAWVSHPFLPNAFSFEADGIDAAPSEEILKMGEDLEEASRLDGTLDLLLLRPKSIELSKRMAKVPPSLAATSTMYGRLNLPTRKTSNLRRDLTRILTWIFRTHSAVNVVPDNGASVVRLIVIGALSGFKKIVLIGVDLNSSSYFWEDPFAGPALRNDFRAYQRPSAPRHDTLETDNRPFSTLDFVRELAKALREVSGTSVMVGSPDSALHDVLENFDWEGTRT